MIVSHTPLRVSFAGGGTDFPVFYEKFGGAVVSTSIDKWINVIVSPRFENDVRVSYSKTEIVDNYSELEHELIREAMRQTGVERGVDIVNLADVPLRGTGLGSSSAVTVGLLNALYAYQGIHKTGLQLAMEAIYIEANVLGKPIGYQDQLACAMGGFNLIQFTTTGKFNRRLIPRSPEFEDHLLLFYTGKQRSASDILSQQEIAIKNGEAVEALKKMTDLAYKLYDYLIAGDIKPIGPLLHLNWRLKQRLVDGISDADIDRWYDLALDAGATGGKILGAGAGGFLLIFASPKDHDRVRSALSDLREVPFTFTQEGTTLTYVR